MEKLMQKPWFEKHRPTKIEEVVFESEIIKNKIEAFIKQGWIEGNIISYGPGGTGKTTINKILLYSIVNNRNDMFTLSSSVQDIDKLKSWLMEESRGSRQRIVICEEFDRLSPEAQTALKNGLMENYMPNVSFIVTTNKIHKIDAALLQRFNNKLNFTKYDINGCYFRMVKILQDEDIVFDENEVFKLVRDFEHKGIRELVNNLQFASIAGEFKLSNLNKGLINSSGVEEVLVSYIKYFIQVIDSIQDTEEIYKICNSPTNHPALKDYYIGMLQIMEQDPSINYDQIFSVLIDDIGIILPLKKIFSTYFQQLMLVPMPHIHLQSCLYEVFVELYMLKGGEKRLKY